MSTPYLRIRRVSQGFWGRREHGQFQPGNRGTKAKYLREQGNKKRFREQGNKALLKGRTKNWKKKRRNRHLSCDIFFAPMSSTFFVFQSVCMELRQGLNWGMSMCYEFTLGNWTLSKIIKKLVGSRPGTQSLCKIAVTTHYTEYGAWKSGTDQGVLRSNPLN